MGKMFFENLKELSHEALIEKLIEHAFKIEQCKTNHDHMWEKTYRGLLEQIKEEVLSRLLLTNNK